MRGIFYDIFVHLHTTLETISKRCDKCHTVASFSLREFWNTTPQETQTVDFDMWITMTFARTHVPSPIDSAPVVGRWSSDPFGRKSVRWHPCRSPSMQDVLLLPRIIYRRRPAGGSTPPTFFAWAFVVESGEKAWKIDALERIGGPCGKLGGVLDIPVCDIAEERPRVPSGIPLLMGTVQWRPCRTWTLWAVKHQSMS